MMKKYFILILAALFVPLSLLGEVRYLSEEEYNDLSKEEREQYWQELENELMMWQQREADARAAIQENEQKIADLQARIQKIDAEYEALYNKIMAELGITAEELAEFQKRLDEVNAQLDYYDELSNSELYAHRDEINDFVGDYEAMKEEKVAKAPDFRDQLAQIDRRIEKLQSDLIAARPKYYEDEHEVVKGECLWIISGYEHIYNDPAQWGIIYRANRDQIKDPDLIYPGQIFKIPRGLPTTWKVYEGECLWTIASYPEIYNDPFQWPIIYRANTDQIEDPDLIYPDQILSIPRD